MKKLLLIWTFSSAAIAFGQVPSYVPLSDLVGWWPFNGNADDESGNGYNGTVIGAILANDRFGNPNAAFDFDGIDDLIDIGLISSIEGISEMTWSAWFKADTVSFNHNIITNRLVNQQLDYMQLKIGEYCDSTTTGMWVATSGHNCGLSGGVIADSLYHLVGVYDGNQGFIKLYLNGVLQSVDLVNGNLCIPELIPNMTPSNGNNLKFGSGGSTTSYFDGVIDDIGIWSRALNECEIQDLYHAQLNSTLFTVSLNGTLLTADQTGASYQWYECSGNGYTELSGETGQTYNAVWNGGITQTYAVTVNMNGCIDTSECYTIDFTGIDELIMNQKELVKIVDLMGRETEFKPNTPLIFIYRDGTTDRIMTLEE